MGRGCSKPEEWEREDNMVKERGATISGVSQPLNIKLSENLSLLGALA